MYNKKIKEIDNIVNDEELLANYIEKIEKDNNIKVPQDLELNIQNKLNINNKNSNIVKFKNIEILKVACFSLLTIMAWNVMFMFNDSKTEFEKKEIEKIQRQEKSEQMHSSIDKVTSKITTFFIMPTLGNERSNIQ